MWELTGIVTADGGLRAETRTRNVAPPGSNPLVSGPGPREVTGSCNRMAAPRQGLETGEGDTERRHPSAHPSVPIGGWTPAMDTQRPIATPGLRLNALATVRSAPRSGGVRTENLARIREQLAVPPVEAHHEEVDEADEPLADGPRPRHCAICKGDTEYVGGAHPPRLAA
ncbi:MAG: hypothetical protein ACQESR_14165 [Planctomycetota bacterium]